MRDSHHAPATVDMTTQQANGIVYVPMHSFPIMVLVILFEERYFDLMSRMLRSIFLLASVSN